MVQAQGGDPRVVDDPEAVLPRAPVKLSVPAPRNGYLAAVDAEALGRASGDLGAGRRRRDDPIDPAVGIVFRPKVGDRVERGDEIAVVHARSDDLAEACGEHLLAALTLSDEPVEAPRLVHSWIGDTGKGSPS
jgi:thymidine phosphorylase